MISRHISLALRPISLAACCFFAACSNKAATPTVPKSEANNVDTPPGAPPDSAASDSSQTTAGGQKVTVVGTDPFTQSVTTNDGRTFSIDLEDDTARILLSKNGGEPVEIFAGAPLVIPIALTLHDETLYIADPAAMRADGQEKGAVFSLPAAGGKMSLLDESDFAFPVDVTTNDTKLVIDAEDDSGEAGLFEHPF